MQDWPLAALPQTKSNTPTAYQRSTGQPLTNRSTRTASNGRCRTVGCGRLPGAASTATQPHRGTAWLPSSDPHGSAAMAKGGFRNIFADGPVVRVDEIDKPHESDDAPAPLRTRNLTGERQKLDPFERLLLALSSRPFWDGVVYVSEHANEHIKTFTKPGRPREHTSADWVMFWRLAEIAKGLRPAEDMLARHTNWLEALQVAQQTAEKLGLTDKDLQLSNRPINRFQFDRFLDRYMGPEQVLELRRLTRGNALRDARTVGLFPPRKGSRPTLNLLRRVYGDGCEYKTMFGPRRKYLDPDTGEVTYSRHDPEAMPHHRHQFVEDRHTGEVTCKLCDVNEQHSRSGAGLDGPLMYEAVTLATRIDERHGRLLLDGDLRTEGETDANLFTDMTLDFKHSDQELQKMPLVVVYDMRLNSTDFDRLQDDGNLVIRKVADDPGGKTKIRVLHDQPFELADGTNTTRDVHVARGTPTLKEYDGDSVEYLIEMTREKIQINDLVNSKALYGEWRVADVPLAKEFAGAMVRISHNSTAEERASDRRRSVFLRVCPESCPEHPAFFGSREDAESINSTHKSQLDDDRLTYKGRIRNQLHLIAHRQNENDKNMYNYLIRRGDMTAYRKRFGYKPMRWEDWLEQAA